MRIARQSQAQGGDIVDLKGRRAPRPWIGAGLIALLGIALIALAIVEVLQSEPITVTRTGARPGQLAPDFELQSTDGRAVRLFQFRGHPVMINFWATWCPPCKAEMPDIEQAFQRHRDDGLVILGVDEQEDPAEVRRFLSSGAFSWTFLLDPDGNLGESYRVTGLPTSYFIDRQGTVQSVQIGVMDGAALDRRLAEIISQ